MNVYVCNPHGYCEGVVGAIAAALKARREYPNQPIYVIGLLVHNEHVIKQLSDLHIVTIDGPLKSMPKKISELAPNSVVVFTAHGHPPVFDQVAQVAKLIIIDATCPRVQENINLIKAAIKNKSHIIYIGQSGHPETEAALALSPQVHLFSQMSAQDFKELNDGNPVLVTNQTTLIYHHLTLEHTQIRNLIPNAIFVNEICPATRMRQAAIEKIPASVELIYVIGSHRSANTNNLFKVAKLTHPKANVHLISGKNEINQQELRGISEVAVSAGASTPPELTDEVISYLREQ